MKGFDLGEFLAKQEEVSKLDTSAGKDRYELIDIDLLDPDPENFYSMDGLEQLKENILLCGLLQPLRVKLSTEPGRYTVIAGHRRREAIRRLVDDGHKEFRMVPCIRDSGGSETLQELKLIYANSDNRDLTAAELSKQALRIEILLYQLQEEGFEFPGRMRDHVAEICKISAPKLARLKVIREGLIPAYMELFNKDELPEQTAYELARLPGEFQERLNRVLSKPPGGSRAEKLLAKYNDGWRWEPELTCPDGKACKRGDTFLRRDCESPGWTGMCGGNTCCLNCDLAKHSYSPCDRMCSKAKALRKEEADKKKAAEHARRAKTGRKYQKETEKNARRLLRAIDAAALPDSAKIPWEYYTSHPVEKIRKWAAGEFDDPAEWYQAKLVPSECRDPKSTAHILGCSTDFLLGLTEDIAPAATAQQEAADAAETQRETPPAAIKQKENLCDQCKAAHPWCDKCCDICDERCNGRQSCRREDQDRPSVKANEGTDWHWWPEKPVQSGLYWCLTGPLTKGGGLYWWEASTSQWEHAGAKGVVLTPSVCLWMPCPELPESMRWERLELSDG